MARSNYINALDSNTVWSNNGVGLVLNYKFWTALPAYYTISDTESNNFQPFTAAMQTAVADIFTSLSTFINVTFVEVLLDNVAQLGFGQAEIDADSLAWAYYPDIEYGGDVWTNNLYPAETQTVTVGSDGFHTLLHEIGHALGLKHPFESPALPHSEENSRYTIMSYDTSPFISESYMLYDISVLQRKYGANVNYATGDDNYALQSGHAYTIWDGGGTDTFDGSALNTNLILNLASGGFSSVGGIRNVAIAYNVTIENASGGSGNDTITGNTSANILDGGTGADTLSGLGGNDTYVIDSGNDSISEKSNAGTDLVQSSVSFSLGKNLEHLTLTGNANVDGVGNKFGNTLTGNSGINSLSGDKGNDTLNGSTGDDTLSGGKGADIFVFDNLTSTDTVSDFKARQGDMLDVSDILNGFVPNTSSISDFLQFQASGQNTLVNIDSDGPVGGTNWVHIATLLSTPNLSLTILYLSGDILV